MLVVNFAFVVLPKHKLLNLSHQSHNEDEALRSLSSHITQCSCRFTHKRGFSKSAKNLNVLLILTRVVYNYFHVFFCVNHMLQLGLLIAAV